ncbi:MAG TPA: asparagine synthase-related protein, partial [Acidimicrobiales bacterium]|nr:asparagine synthase-related protein [Acidimicrobiales bacterium]
AMTATMAHRGPDGVGEWVRGPVALAHLLLRTTSVEVAGRQPLEDPTGQVVLTLDGRIDNRAEIRSDLGGEAALLRDRSDPELLLRAYLRWGRACLRRMVGDFAVAVWDGRTRELLLARDFLGARPLLYHQGAHGLRWASEPQAVMADPTVPRTIDAAMVGEHLSTTPRSLVDTPLVAVKRVPPAHALVWRDGRVRLERHWTWEPGPARTGDPQDLARELMDVLETATGAALDAPGPVAAELSGGVDSSTIVGLADRLVRDGRAPGPLEVLSLVFPGRPHDESQHIRAVAHHLGIGVTELEPAPAGRAHYVEQIHRHLDLPEPPNVAMHRELHATARERGARVLLTGKGGDEWLTGSRLQLADALRRGRLRQAWHTASVDRHVFVARGRLHQLGRDGLLPILPAALQRLAGRLAGHDDPPRWLTRAFWAEHHLADRLRRPTLRGPSLATAEVAGWLEDGTTVALAESRERTLARAGLEGRSPFDDRRVVELALALPDLVRRRGPNTKWAVRVGTEGLIPDAVRRRSDKANVVPAFTEELDAQGGASLYAHLRLEELGWVDGAVVRALWEDHDAARRASDHHPWAWALWNIAWTDAWVCGIVRNANP